MLLELLECEAKCKQPLDIAARQRARQALPAQ
jgi:hypothetical protein